MINIQRVNAETGQITEVIELDITISANLQHSMTVTQFPVEQGAFVSDHAEEQPAQVTIQSMVSATPLRIISVSPFIDSGRPRAAFEIMKELQTSKELVRIVTDVETYDNMALTSLSAPRNIQTKNSLLFTAVFQELRLASSQIVTLPDDEEVQQTASVKEEGGKVVPKPTESDKDKAKAASTLYKYSGGQSAEEFIDAAIKEAEAQ